MANAKEVGKIVSTVAKAGKKALSSADDAVKTGAKLAGSSGRVAARNAAKYGSKAGKNAGRRKVHNARRQGGQKAANVNEGAGGWGNPKFSSSSLDDATATGRSGAKASAAVADDAAVQAGAAVTGEGGSRAVKLYKGLRTITSDMGKGAAFVGKNWKGFAATVFGWNYFVKDKGLFEQAKGVMFTDKEMAELKNKGGVGFIKEGLFGEEGSSKSVLENTVDTLAGDGVYQTGTGIVSTTFDTVGGVVKGVTGAVGDTYDGVKGYLAGNERGHLAGNEGGTQYGMPVGTDGNMSSMPIGSTIASMFSGRMLNLASLIGAGILMFGNYGTMGKLASLGLGGMALKGMNSRNSSVVQQPSRPQSYGDLRSIPVSQERVVDEAVQRALDNASDVNIVRRRI